MIVGNGLIANAFKDFDQEEVIFYASGVSNSLETDELQFLREENLIRKSIAENPGKIFIYFSTCSIYDSSKNGSAYVNHKLKMEHLVKSECGNYLIARVSNAVGMGGNQNTLINFLVNSIKNQTNIAAHINATRNLIDVQDVVQIVLNLIKSKQLNRIVNVAYLSDYPVVQIISIVEKHLNLKANLDLVNAGQSYSIDVKQVENYFHQQGLENKKVYLSNILKKYF